MMETSPKLVLMEVLPIMLEALEEKEADVPSLTGFAAMDQHQHLMETGLHLHALMGTNQSALKKNVFNMKVRASKTILKILKYDYVN